MNRSGGLLFGFRSRSDTLSGAAARRQPLASMPTTHRRAQIERLLRSPELTIDRLQRETTVGLYVVVPFLALLAGSFSGSALVRDSSRVLLASLVLSLLIWHWLDPRPPKATPRPIVFWMRRFNGSAAELHRAQRFLESTICDCCVVILADNTVRVDSESRLMSGWRFHVAAISTMWFLSWLQSWGGGAAVLGSLMTAAYSVNIAWMRFKARPLSITASSEMAFREAIEAIRSRRIERRSVIFLCPADSPVWEGLVDDLIPFADAAVVSNRDLRWADAFRAGAIQDSPLPGLVKELAKTAAALGPQKTVVLLRDGDTPGSGAEGMQSCVLPERVGLLPLDARSKRLAVCLQSAVIAPRAEPATVEPHNRFWSPGDDRRRRWWQLAGVVLSAPAVLLVGLVLAALGNSLFDDVAQRMLRAAGGESVLVQPSRLGDDLWRGSWVTIAIFASLSFVYWFWRKRPLSNERLVSFSTGLGFCLLATGCNFDNSDRVPREALAFANLAAAFAALTAVSTLRRVKPESWRGALAHSLSLWGLVFSGVLIPLSFGIGLLFAETRHLEARFIHPLTYASLGGALVAVAWMAWADASKSLCPQVQVR